MTAMIPAMDGPTIEKTTTSKRVTRLLGIDLHSWELVMLLALGIVAIGGVAVVAATYGVIMAQRSEVAAANRELEAYKAQAATEVAKANATGETAKQAAAEANARAEQANLELQRLRMPRVLNDDTLVAHLAGKAAWPVTEILYVDEMDSSFLAMNIAVALGKAGWPTPIPRVIRGPNPSWEYGIRAAEAVSTPITWGAQPVGVSVVSSSEPDPDGRSPAVTLWTAIAKAISEGQTNLGRDNSMPPRTIRIVVAPRR